MKKKQVQKNEPKSANKGKITKKIATKRKKSVKKVNKPNEHLEALQYLVDAEENETRLMIASTMGLTDD